MPESEPKGGLSPDDSFAIAWNINRFEELALDPESLASVIADAAARLNDESLENARRLAYGLIFFGLAPF